MIAATDSFIQYLHDGLAGNPPVAWLHTSSDDPNTSVFQVNALNVSVLSVLQDASLEQPLISLDLIGSDERTVMGWARRVRNLLFEQQYTPEYDYAANPSAPVSTGWNVFWKPQYIQFAVVQTSTQLVHVNATFPITHVRA